MKVIESGKLLDNQSYFSPVILNSRLYALQRDGNIKTIISLKTVIKSDTSVKKLIFISELPPYLETFIIISRAICDVIKW